ncbi:hypothetical protein LIER_08322 [Lithospermum erythrorhizon]|uniref:Uncharacterized protein n=1 Tax=Lithospermum erythrorhizon TaxID=34254 RepID=A0AAV3PBM0_LITER
MATEYNILNEFISHTLPSEWSPNPKEISFTYLPLYSFPYHDFSLLMADNSPQEATSAAPGTVQRILQEESGTGNRPTPPSGGRDNEEVETFAAFVLTDPAADVTKASRGRHVEVPNVSVSKKCKRATTKKAFGKAVAPAAGNERAIKKKGARVS